MGYRTESAELVAEAKDDNEVKDTKVLKFTSNTRRDDAREGKTIRFMHDMGNGTPHWLQGTIEKRLTKYKTAISSKFTKNRFRIGSLSIISQWGEQTPLPGTVICSIQ